MARNIPIGDDLGSFDDIKDNGQTWRMESDVLGRKCYFGKAMLSVIDTFAAHRCTSLARRLSTSGGRPPPMPRGVPTKECLPFERV